MSQSDEGDNETVKSEENLPKKRFNHDEKLITKQLKRFLDEVQVALCLRRFTIFPTQMWKPN